MTDTDTTAVLAHHLGRLDADACAALVADLWAARGFETIRDGGSVVATRRGSAVHIRVGVPGGPDAADQPDVDLVVSPRNGRAARAFAAAADARLLDATALAESLRYAVDRPTARALCERHLGAPPEALQPPLGARLGGRVARLRDAVSPARAVTPTGGTVRPRRTAPVFGVVLVLLVAAVAGVALTGPSGDVTDGAAGVEPLVVPESTPVGDTAVGTATATPDPGPSVVPGLSDEGVVDLSALAAAHARSLLGRTYTLWMDTYRPSAGSADEGRVQIDTDVAVAGDRFLVHQNVGDGGDRERIRVAYHDGEDWYVAEETTEGRTYGRLTPDDPVKPPDASAIALGLVADYLSTPETSVEGPVEGEAGGEGPTLYRLVGRGTPPTMAGAGVRNYTAIALVDRDGLVRDLTVTYTVEGDDGPDRIRKEWTYGYLGTTTVEAPAWYDERFAANATAAPTPAG